MISQELLETIRNGFSLDWEGNHGIGHFLRVRDNGLRLAERTGARRDLVELFAFLHDSKRQNELFDRNHGARAAEFLRTLQGDLIHLNSEDLELLAHACKDHAKGLKHGDVTVITCWDADRLDLGRVGAKPSPRKLCTDAAKDPQTIEWAYKRSIQASRGIVSSWYRLTGRTGKPCNRVT